MNTSMLVFRPGLPPIIHIYKILYFDIRLYTKYKGIYRTSHDSKILEAVRKYAKIGSCLIGVRIEQ